MKYRVVYHAHPEVASVHLALPYRICDRIHNFTLADVDQATIEYVGLLRSMLEVPGVMEVFVKAYSFTIHKDPAFAWDEPLWGVLMVLRQAYGPLEELGNPIHQPEDPDCTTVHTPTTAILH